jgi:hypothetical protein
MPHTYDLIIKKNGILKTIEVQSDNQYNALKAWEAEDGESIKGIVFNDKNHDNT